MEQDNEVDVEKEEGDDQENDTSDEKVRFS